MPIMAMVWGLLASVVLPAWAWAATFYMSPTGQTPEVSCATAQNQTTPKQTFASVLPCMAAGDTLILLDGTYDDTFGIDTVQPPSGLSTSVRTTIKALHRRLAILRPNAKRNTTPSLSLIGLDRNFLHIEGLVLDGSVAMSDIGPTRGTIGIAMDGSNSLFLDNEIKHVILAYEVDGQNNIFRNFFAHDIGYLATGGKQECRAASDPSNHWDGLCPGMSLVASGSGHLVEGGHIEHANGYGIQVDASNVQIRNTFIKNVDGGIFLGGTGNAAYNNVIDDAHINFAGGGTYAHNTAYNNKLISLYTGQCCGQGSGDTNSYGAYVSAGTVLKNNLFVLQAQGIAASNYLYVGGVPASVGANVAGNVCDTSGATGCTVSAGTHLVSGSTGDYHLRSDSGAINAAVSTTSLGLSGLLTDRDGVARPQGAATDTGAYEFNAAPAPVPDTPALVETIANCGSATCMQALVLGGLFYLPADAAFTGTALATSRCANGVAYMDVASLVGAGFTAVRPFFFSSEGIGLAENVCENCLAVHAGSASINEGGSGWTLSNFREGATLTQATGGANAYATMPGLCKQSRGGVITTTPLWPWPMDQRIQAARSLAGRSPVNITATVQGLLGPIPDDCTTAPTPPSTQSTWFIATGGVDGAACTLAAPCATLAHVAGRMSGGHTVYLRAGTYAQRIDSAVAPFPGGTSWSTPTVIAAYENEVVTLQLNTNTLARFATPSTDRYIVLDRLILDGSASTSTTTNGLVVSNGAGPIRFQNGIIRNTYFERVLLNGSSGVEILNSTITTGTSLPAVRVLGTTLGLLLEGNTISSSPAVGVEFVSGSFSNIRINRNTIHTCGGAGLRIGSGTFTVSNTLIHHCTLGMEVLTGSNASLVANLTLADNSAAGFQVNAGAVNTALTNTLVFGNGSGIVNNGTGTVQTTNLTTNPGFVGGGNYRIASPSSPAVDTGTTLDSAVIGTQALDGSARVQGVGQDIGAYEQSGSGPPPPTPTEVRARPWTPAMILQVPH